MNMIALGKRLALGLILTATAAAQDPIVLQNDTHFVEFFADGSLARLAVVDIGTPPVDETGRRMIDLLDAEVVAAANLRPFALNNPNDARLPVDLADWTGRIIDATTAEFTATDRDSGLEITKRWQLDDNYVLRLSVRAALDDSTSLVLGPGLGYSLERRPEAHDEARAPFVQSVIYAGDEVLTIDTESEIPAAPRWAGFENRDYALLVVPQGGALANVTPTVISLAETADLVDEADAINYPLLLLTAQDLSAAEFAIYAGPRRMADLEASGLGIDSLAFHDFWGWFAWLCRTTLRVLAWLKGIVGSWGLAIIAFAVLFRLVMLPITIAAFRSQREVSAKMAALKPRMAEIRAKYKTAAERDDAILALYKEVGVSPMSHALGCLPVLFQLPVFIALLQLLAYSPELRGVPFLWIDDLSLPDRLFPLGVAIPWLGSYFNLLPVLLFVVQLWASFGMKDRSGDNKSSLGGLLAFPLVMTLVCYPFPAGCLLFWTTTILLQAVEQTVFKPKPVAIAAPA